MYMFDSAQFVGGSSITTTMQFVHDVSSQQYAAVSRPRVGGCFISELNLDDVRWFCDQPIVS